MCNGVLQACRYRKGFLSRPDRLDVCPEQRFIVTATKPWTVFGQVYSKRSIVFMMKKM